ncbi:MAG TPA: protein translocase subunit SecF [Gemmatimonadaceae bacterium]|nr:protein translocase subunit SecF [Gemmatimonadaceae bacterium]
MLRILHGTSYDFIKYWRHAAIATIAFIVIGLAALGIRGARYSIEFTGGTLMQVHFTKPPQADAIRQTVDRAGFSGSTIQQFGTLNDYTISAQPKGLASGATSDSAASEVNDSTARQIETALHAQFGDTSQVKVLRSEYVGPRVGAELRRNALVAVLISFLVTLIYLAIRFEWRFGVAAVVATAHDIFTTLAFLAMMRLEISLTVVAAILTVIGYSLNDTIIIFDRVRENLKKQRKESLYDVMNRSINETLPRSILTHVTTLIATLALLFFAGEVIRPFSWIMAFGIFTGTFSSIYVAGALLLWIEAKWPRSLEGQGGAGVSARAGAAQARRREASP